MSTIEIARRAALVSSRRVRLGVGLFGVAQLADRRG
jgi:hypothetical protein